MQDMKVSELVARMLALAATMRVTAEEYEIEARFHADKALDLRLGVMELEQRITFITEFVDGEPDETSAAKPGSEVAASDAAAALAGEAVPPSTSPAPISEDHLPDAGNMVSEQHSAASPTDEAGTASSSDNSTAARMDGRQVIGSEEDGAAFDAGAMTSQAGTQAPPVETIPTYSRAGHIGTWVRGDEKALDPAPAGGAATSPAPTVKERVKSLHDKHPEYTRKQACEALGITEGSLAGHGHSLGIRWSPSPASPKFKAGQPAPPAVQYAPGSTGDRVRIVHEQHPTWTARMIADHLGALEKTVANILGELRRQAKAAPPPEFAGRAEMVGHYTDVAKRLGKV